MAQGHGKENKRDKEKVTTREPGNEREEHTLRDQVLSGSSPFKET